MGKATAVKAGSGFIVNHLGHWFRVPRKLVSKNSDVNVDAFKQHLKQQQIKATKAGRRWNKPQRRELFLGNNPRRTSKTARKVKDELRNKGVLKTQMENGKPVEKLNHPPPAAASGTSWVTVICRTSRSMRWISGTTAPRPSIRIRDVWPDLAVIMCDSS